MSILRPDNFVLSVVSVRQSSLSYLNNHRTGFLGPNQTTTRLVLKANSSSQIGALSLRINSRNSVSENRDRGGIQWNSEPTSPPAPLLKINTIYVGFSGLLYFQRFYINGFLHIYGLSYQFWAPSKVLAQARQNEAF